MVIAIALVYQVLGSFSLAASVIRLIQMPERVISLCK